MMPSTPPGEELIIALAGALVALNSQFLLPCGRCWKMYKAANTAHLPFDDANRRRVAVRFAECGWQFSNTAICPHCAKY
jgi:hypothetical protein